MVKRFKRIEKGTESLKEQIEEHFSKIENDICESRIDRGRYHIKEIEKSLLESLELKIKILGTNDDSVEIYKKRLKKIKERIDRL